MRLYSNTIKTRDTAVARWGVRLLPLGNMGKTKGEGNKKTTEGACVCAFDKRTGRSRVIFFASRTHTQRKTRVDKGREVGKNVERDKDQTTQKANN